MGRKSSRRYARGAEVKQPAPLQEWTVADLRALAADNDVDLKGLTTKAEILEAIEDR